MNPIDVSYSAMRHSGQNESKTRRDKRKLEVLNGVLQLLAVIFAITFGIFAILAWQSGANQLKQAEIGNQLTLLSYCASASVRNS
jgi:hypothetical protein